MLNRDNRSNETLTPVAGGFLGAAARVSGRVSSAALSTAKTSLLRRDRVSDGHHAARLAVCGDCPGGHALKGNDGSLRTCGPMLASLTVEGKSPCWCVLNQKASVAVVVALAEATSFRTRGVCRF